MISRLSFLFAALPALLIARDVKAQPAYYTETPKGFAFIPPCKIPHNGDTVYLQAFCISIAEVANAQYREFLDDLQKRHDTAGLAIAAIKEEKWNDFQFVNAKEYAYWSDYPVVNISKEGAELYCRWLSRKLSQKTEGNMGL